MLLLVFFLSVSIVSADNSTLPSYEINTESEQLIESVSTSSNSDTFTIDDNSYSSYFDNKGNLINSTVKSGDTLVIGNLSAKEIIINMPLNVTSISNSLITNSKFTVTSYGSGSNLTNLNIYVTTNQFASTSISPIFLDVASDNIISNNNILIDYSDNANSTYFNLIGISTSGASYNNTISYNKIDIRSHTPNMERTYMYGISLVSDYMSTIYPTGNAIYSNIINLVNDYYIGGITLSKNKDFLIENNTINAQSNNLVYGITLEYCYTEDNTTYNLVKGNKIQGTGSMVYLLQNFDSSNMNFTNNDLKGTGNAVYGIGAFSSKNHIISNNEIFVSGRNISLVRENFDAITSGHAGIYYMRNSNNIDVFNNLIVSSYLLGGDYAVLLDSTSLVNVSIDDNILISNGYSYLGDNAISGNVNKSNNSGNYTLLNTNLNVNASDIDFGENATVNVRITPNAATGKIIIRVNGTDYISNLDNGVSIFSLPDLNPGNYLVEVFYDGDKNYKVSNTNTTFTVNYNNYNTTLTGGDIELYFKNGTQYVVYLKDSRDNPLVNKTIEFIINNNPYNRTTDIDGKAAITINLNPGLYNVSASFKGEGNYTSSKVNNTAKILTTLEGEDITKFFRNDTQYYVTLFDGEGKAMNNRSVLMNINGVFYNRTSDANGTVKLSINLNPGEYEITTTHPDTELKMTNIIKVLATLEGKDIEKYYKNGTQYQVKLLDSQGNAKANTTLSMNINGVFYERTTNSDGIATLSINLNPGDYIITVENLEDNSKISNNIKVLPTLVGQDVSMSSNDRKPYEVKLVDGRGNAIANEMISININGVFYDRETDSSGIARLNINLDPNSYIATAIYGDYSSSNTIIVS